MSSTLNSNDPSDPKRTPASVIQLRANRGERPAPSRIILTNCEALNGGDAAILLAIVSLVRKTWPGVRLTLMARDAALAARLYPEFEWQDLLAATPLFRRLMNKRFLSRALEGYALLADKLDLGSLEQGLNRVPLGLREFGRRLLASGLPQIAAYRDADLVLSTGGTYLVSRYNLEPRIVEFLLAKLHGLPLVLYTQSIGSLATSRWAESIAKCLSDAKLVLVRDAESLQNLAALGLTPDGEGPTIKQYADVVFALADEGVLQAAKKRQLPTKGFRACISVRPWAEFDKEAAGDGMARYTQAIASLCERLVRHYDADIEFISTCQGTPGYSRDDSSVAQSIAERLPNDVRRKVTVDQSFHTPHALMEHLGSADVVIATRMHMAILSLCAGTPVLPIEYEFKTRHLFHHLGFPQWVQGIQSVTSESLVNAFDAFVAEVDSSRERLFEAVLGQHRSACASFDAVCEALDYPPRRAEAEPE